MPKERGLKVFIDSSVLFAAVLSPSGGSFRIFQEARGRGIELFITPHVVTEVAAALEEKYPQTIEYFRSFLIRFAPAIVREPSGAAVERYVAILPMGDAAILAAAIVHNADYLITLDKKHFIEGIKHIKLPITTMTPGDLIKKHFV